MILIATNKRDVTSDFVVIELRRRGVDFIRLNTEDISDYEIEIPGGDPSALTFQNARTSFNISDITSAYYRRPGRPEPNDNDQPTADYLTAEWSAILRTLWNVLEGRWLNSPFAILRAEDKPRQLAAARKAGFTVPDTLVTNKIDAALAFVGRGTLVAKPLRHALLDNNTNGSVIFTNRIEKLIADDKPAVRRAPMILQREITKSSDIRVIVIDEKVFATKIESQRYEETQVDWRRGIYRNLTHKSITLPKYASDACICVTQALGLRFAAIDLVEDLAGDLWFLEANPNGQWAWIEQRTGAPIAAAIAEGLVR